MLSNLFVNAAAAKRILGLPASRKIEFRYVGQTVIVIWEKSLGEVSLQKEDFENHFVEFRRQGAKECIARPHKKIRDAEIYRVTGTRGDVYYVEASAEGLRCTCEDWLAHQSICKHGWATLNLLGLSSLEGYVKARDAVNAIVPEWKRKPVQVGAVPIE
jgi:hypothetical protein